MLTLWKVQEYQTLLPDVFIQLIDHGGCRACLAEGEVVICALIDRPLTQFVYDVVQQHQQRPQISSMQLQQILQTNKLPDGRLLTPEMRNALIQKINGSRQAQQRNASYSGAPAALFPQC